MVITINNIIATEATQTNIKVREFPISFKQLTTLFSPSGSTIALVI